MIFSIKLRPPFEINKDLIAFAAAGFFSPSPLSAAVCGIFNAIALAACDELAKTAEQAWTLKKVIVMTGSLAASALAAPPLFRLLALPLTQSEAFAIAGMNAALKTAFCLLEGGTLSLHKIYSNAPILNHEEARSLFFFQIKSQHQYFKDHVEKFNALDLRSQIALNLRFETQKLSCLPFPEFTELGEGFTEEELKFLYNCLTNRSLPMEPLLPLTKQFFECRLPAPSTLFSLETFIPPSDLDVLKPEESYLISWTFTYYRSHLKEWQALPLEKQYHYNCHFDRQGWNILLHYPKEGNKLSKEMVHLLNEQYKALPSAWYQLSLPLRKELNKQFSMEKGCSSFKPFAHFISDLAFYDDKEELKRLYALFRSMPSLEEELSAKEKKALYRRFDSLWLPLNPEEQSFLHNQFLREAKIASALFFTVVASALAFNIQLQIKQHPDLLY